MLYAAGELDGDHEYQFGCGRDGRDYAWEGVLMVRGVVSPGGVISKRGFIRGFGSTGAQNGGLLWLSNPVTWHTGLVTWHNTNVAITWNTGGILWGGRTTTWVG